ncbi:acyl carrier protein [Streptomyces hirsutus]|uniref:acyl carrier protein n=1 Tax=Streptomyces hirsutus TaxID=35620 RepID=UPI00386A8696|nr:acyl carrier protein [Streptomyces hirsutus]
MTQPPDPNRATSRVLAIWNEVLGPGTDPDLGFLANGGDSFRAVTLSVKLFEETGVEIDFLDILESDNAHAIHRLVQSGSGAH